MDRYDRAVSRMLRAEAADEYGMEFAIPDHLMGALGQAVEAIVRFAESKGVRTDGFKADVQDAVRELASVLAVRS